MTTHATELTTFCVKITITFFAAILGLMVLAVGNSVGDWATNTAVSRDGHSEIGVASCFRSPLLNDVIGLSVALIVSGKLFS